MSWFPKTFCAWCWENFNSNQIQKFSFYSAINLCTLCEYSLDNCVKLGNYVITLIFNLFHSLTIQSNHQLHVSSQQKKNVAKTRIHSLIQIILMNKNERIWQRRKKSIWMFSSCLSLCFFPFSCSFIYEFILLNH